MKALRLVIKQNSANYRKEETIDNKMTYPLPPISTVIGAIHNACGYHEYIPMDISIQGKYDSLQEKLYRDDCFLDSLNNDRGWLVKVLNPDLLSSGYILVATAKKKQGNDFYKGTTIDIKNQKLLNEYRKLYDARKSLDLENKTIIQPAINELKKSKKELVSKRKELEKTSNEYKQITEEIDDINKKISKMTTDYSEKRKKCEEEYSYFKTLTKSVKKYEILTDIYLIIHIRAAENILNEIMEHVYDIQSLGRSEDFVHVENAEIVELDTEINDEIESPYSAYIDYNAIKKQHIFTNKMVGQKTGGTLYYINKNYEIIDNKRIFHKKKVIYTSHYFADESSEDVYIDEYNGQKLIVNFL